MVLYIFKILLQEIFVIFIEDTVTVYKHKIWLGKNPNTRICHWLQLIMEDLESYRIEYGEI